MLGLRRVALLALLAAAWETAGADTLRMDGATAFEGDGRPTRGMSQTKVESKYGAPSTIRAAVGDPPITRWDYPEFVVYFEYDKVIHAVRKR